MTQHSENELSRLEALKRLGVLDTPQESEFDGIVQAAALICDVPVSLISLIDSDRQWFKANVGLTGVTETPREVSFCSHTILENGLLEVSDATKDIRFETNPLVTGEPEIRFYAGVTLRLSDGAHVGSLCVIDRVARKLTDRQKAILQHLSSTVVKALEARQLANSFAISQARFQALSDSSPLGVFSTDVHGACTYPNAQWQAIFGMGSDEAEGHGWSRTLHPDDRESIFTEWQRTASLQRNFDMEFRIQHDSGAVIYVRAISRPVLSDNGQVSGHIGSVEDVTERRQAQEAARQSEAMLKETSKLANVGGCELEIATGELRWSDQYCRIHGLEPGYQPGMQEAIDFYVPEDQPVIRQAVENALTTGEAWDLELRLVQITGQIIWVRIVGHAELIDGKPVRLRGAMQDITAQIQHRNALEHAQERTDIATESGEIGIWEWNIQDGTLNWTERMFTLFGLPAGPSEVPYELWTSSVHPEDQEFIAKVVQDAIAGSGHLDTEFRIVWPDGSVHHLRASAHITRDQEGVALKMLGVNWDVTSLRQLSHDLAAQAEMLRVTLESIGDAVITTDASGNVTWQNPVAETMTGWKSDDATGKPLSQVFNIVNEETRQQAINPVSTCLKLGKIVGLANHTLLISYDGTEFGIEDSAAPILDKEGTLLGAVLVFHDVTEQRRLSNEMSYRATHDALTGLVNRVEFETHLQRALLESDENHCENSLMFIDLDQFKLVNDACGHSAGDQLLVKIAKLLASTVRKGDTLARLGGDEFGVILQNCNRDQANDVAQHICTRMDEFRFTHDERKFRIGTSIGLVPLDNRWPDTAAAMQAADFSCYAAKEAGRNRVHAWFDTDEVMRQHQGEMQWAIRLEEALDKNRFELYQQKIKPLSSQKAGMHMEILIRLREHDGRLTMPNAFLPAAERFNLATRIDRWVLDKAIEEMTLLLDHSDVELVCVNLSGQSIGDRVFHREANEMLMSAGAPVCQRLCLEITETAAVTNMADATVFIDQARALGVRIALDDFGAGASSFGYLRTLTVDYLKIDGQFIKNLMDEPLNKVAVSCFVDAANVMGIETIAEYVDSPESLDQVRKLGINYAQGFLIHQPEPIGCEYEEKGYEVVQMST